jgi:Tfp pilus assembly protein PilV
VRAEILRGKKHIRTGGRKGRIFGQAGYTLVETLVAGALFLGVLVPATLFLSRSAMNRSALDLSRASFLAQEEMENTLASKRYQDEEKEIPVGRQAWRIQRETGENDGLVELRVSVFKPGKTDPLVVFRTLRTMP